MGKDNSAALGYPNSKHSLERLFPDWPLAGSWEPSSWNILTDKSVLHVWGHEPCYNSFSEWFILTKWFMLNTCLPSVGLELSNWVSHTGLCICDWSPMLWATRLKWAYLVDKTVHMLSHIIAEGRVTSCVTPPGGASWKLVPGFLQTLLHAPFPFEILIYPFAVINCTCKNNNFCILWVLLGHHQAWGWSWRLLTHWPNGLQLPLRRTNLAGLGKTCLLSCILWFPTLLEWLKK